MIENGIAQINLDSVVERLEQKKEGTGELNPTYFKSIVGNLRYLTSTKPDITYGV